MKSFSNFVQLLFLLLLCGISALAQTTAAPEAKQFTKDGLSLNYPAGWSFNDTSNDHDTREVGRGETYPG